MGAYEDVLAMGPTGAAAPTGTAGRSPLGGYTAPSKPLTGGEAFDRQYGVTAAREKQQVDFANDEARRAAIFSGTNTPIPEPTQWQPNLTGEPPIIYYEGDEVSAFAGASYEEKFRVQRQLVDAGLLTSTFRAGVWDGASQAAMREAMTYANQMGLPVQQALGKLAEATLVGPKPKDLIPNTRELSEIVEATFESYLKRKPSKAEIAELAGNLREQYEAAIGTEDFTPEELSGVDMPDYDTDLHAIDEEEEFDPADINAAFEQQFKNRYADEIGAVERVDDYRAQDVAPVFDGVSSAMAQTPSGPGFIPTPGA